ncbi:MAG: penicillin-binding transpeptidase domain-containing protein [Moraxella sp.]
MPTVSPLLASDGHLTPHLLKKSTGAEHITPLEKPDGKFNTTVINDWQRMHLAMEDVVKKGTAHNIYTPTYRIAGKTGTAQVKSIAQGKRYNEAALDSRHWDMAGLLALPR